MAQQGNTELRTECPQRLKLLWTPLPHGKDHVRRDFHTPALLRKHYWKESGRDVTREGN